jgi:hypothetical protein
MVTGILGKSVQMPILFCSLPIHLRCKILYSICGLEQITKIIDKALGEV